MMKKLILAALAAGFLAVGSANAQQSATDALSVYGITGTSTSAISPAISVAALTLYDTSNKPIFETDANGKLVKADWPAIKKACDNHVDLFGGMTEFRAVACALVAAGQTKPEDWKR